MLASSLHLLHSIIKFRIFLISKDFLIFGVVSINIDNDAHITILLC